MTYNKISLVNLNDFNKFNYIININIYKIYNKYKYKLNSKHKLYTIK